MIRVQGATSVTLIRYVTLNKSGNLSGICLSLFKLAQFDFKFPQIGYHIMFTALFVGLEAKLMNKAFLE